MTDDRWVPVSERLPEAEVTVLVCDDRGVIGVGFFYDECMGWETYYPASMEVTAWRELPPPYRGEGA